MLSDELTAATSTYRSPQPLSRNTKLTITIMLSTFFILHL